MNNSEPCVEHNLEMLSEAMSYDDMLYMLGKKGNKCIVDGCNARVLELYNWLQNGGYVNTEGFAESWKFSSVVQYPKVAKLILQAVLNEEIKMTSGDLLHLNENKYWRGSFVEDCISREVYGTCDKCDFAINFDTVELKLKDSLYASGRYSSAFDLSKRLDNVKYMQKKLNDAYECVIERMSSRRFVYVLFMYNLDDEGANRPIYHFKFADMWGENWSLVNDGVEFIVVDLKKMAECGEGLLTDICHTILAGQIFDDTIVFKKALEELQERPEPAEVLKIYHIVSVVANKFLDDIKQAAGTMVSNDTENIERIAADKATLVALSKIVAADVSFRDACNVLGLVESRVIEMVQAMSKELKDEGVDVDLLLTSAGV